MFRLVWNGLRVSQHFTVQNRTWNSGAVRTLGREAVARFWAEDEFYKMAQSFASIQSVLITAPPPSSSNASPLTARTGMEALPPTATFLRKSAVQTCQSLLQTYICMNLRKKFRGILSPNVASYISFLWVIACPLYEAIKILSSNLEWLFDSSAEKLRFVDSSFAAAIFRAWVATV